MCRGAFHESGRRSRHPPPTTNCKKGRPWFKQRSAIAPPSSTQKSLSERGLVLPAMETFQRVKTCHGIVYLIRKCTGEYVGQSYLPTVIPMSLSMLYFMLAAPPRSHCDKSILRSYSLPADPLPSTSMFQGIYTMNFPAGMHS